MLQLEGPELACLDDLLSLQQHLAPVDRFGQTDGILDVVLVWFDDADAGSGSVTSTGDVQTHVAVLVGLEDGTFVDPAPNQFVSGDDPADGDVGDVDDGGTNGRGNGPDVVVPNRVCNKPNSDRI